MQRRDFLKATTTVITGATLAPRRLAGNPPLPAGSASEGRLVLPLNCNWRYNTSLVEGGHAREFDDSAFKHVVIPHTNARCHGIALTRRLTNSSPSIAAGSNSAGSAAQACFR